MIRDYIGNECIMSNSKDKIKKQREQLSETYKKELTRNLYKQSFFEFVKDATKVLEPMTVWDWNWHHEYICSTLQEEALRIKNNLPKIQDLNINVPPRTSKSLIVSVCYNAWVWGCVSPYMSFLMISHSDGLTVELASKTKDLIESDWYKEFFPEVQIRMDTQAKSNFKNTFGGARVSTSMGASITGFGANFIIIDDALDANNVSDIYIENTNRKYKETIYNRLNNPQIDLRVIIGQRVHENDLSGHIKANDHRHKYKSIILPIELTQDVEPVDLAEQYQGGLLWPTRFPVDSFPDLTTSDYVFATQYLQRPAPLAGGLIKKDWFEVVSSVPNDIRYDLFIDTAQTKDIKKNDPSTILVAGVKDNTLYVRDCHEVWLEFPDLLRKISEVGNLYSNGKIWIEPKSNGKDIAASLRRETMLNVIELDPPRDGKLTRTTAVTPKMESRRVKLLQGSWNDGFLDQLSLFPNGRHDGQVDTVVYAIGKLLIGSGKMRWYM